MNFTDINNIPCLTAPRGFEAININIIERNINSIRKLPKIPKKKENIHNKQKYPLIYSS
jgi:hypothetical protein